MNAEEAVRRRKKALVIVPTGKIKRGQSSRSAAVARETLMADAVRAGVGQHAQLGRVTYCETASASAAVRKQYKLFNCRFDTWCARSGRTREREGLEQRLVDYLDVLVLSGRTMAKSRSRWRRRSTRSRELPAWTCQG